MNVKTDHQLDFCIGCVVGKQCKNPFQKGDPQKTHQSPFKLIHTNLCSSMKTTSVGGAKHFMTFTNDNTIMLWTYIMKQKLEALVVFKEFQAMVEVSSKRKIKAIQSHNNGEFISKVFKDHYKVKGIQQ
jgi:hypothetical protein